MTYLEICRQANVWLGIAAGLGVGYRAVLGMHQRKIAYPLLFSEFVATLMLVGIGSSHAQGVNAPTSYVTACWTVLLSSIVLTCLFHEHILDTLRKLRRHG